MLEQKIFISFSYYIKQQDEFMCNLQLWDIQIDANAFNFYTFMYNMYKLLYMSSLSIKLVDFV